MENTLYNPSLSLTPYILEERQLNVTQMDVFSRLMKDRMLFAWGEVNGNMCSQLGSSIIIFK